MDAVDRLQSSSLFGRVAAGFVIGFLLLHAGSLLFYNHEKMVAEAGNFAAGIGDRAVRIAEVAGERPELLELLSTPSFTLSYAGSALEAPARVWPHTDEIRAVLVDSLRGQGFDAADQIRFWYSASPRRREFVLQLPLDDRWLLVRADGFDARGHTAIATFWTTILGLVILVLVLLLTRRFTRVLPLVAAAAERVGRDAEPNPLAESGPREVRRLVRVFNDMQRRVTGLLRERNTMLGALSHDLRTLVTRLALRLDRLDNEALRAKSEQDVRAITALLDETLAYAREEAASEAAVAVDLPSLLQALLDDEADRGLDPVKTDYQGPEALVVQAGPVGLRRVFGNLIDNALRYAGAVSVQVESLVDGSLQVDVTDPGPGIPVADQERALQPFERLEPSRNRETGGSGLGLSIARSLVERMGGTLGFPPVSEGFTVRVTLPSAQTGSTQLGHQK